MVVYCIRQLRQQPVLGRTGSWAGPAWFKMLLGLGGNQGGGVRGWGEKGEHILSVFLGKHINVHFSYKYALLCFQTLFP